METILYSMRQSRPFPNMLIWKLISHGNIFGIYSRAIIRRH